MSGDEDFFACVNFPEGGRRLEHGLWQFRAVNRGHFLTLSVLAAGEAFAGALSDQTFQGAAPVCQS